jgi:hypothetical protein
MSREKVTDTVRGEQSDDSLNEDPSMLLSKVSSY